MSLENKIEILNNILNDLVKYSDSFNKVKCHIDKSLIIIEQELKKPKYDPVTIKIPVSDIDKVIIRERAKLAVHNNYENKPNLKT